MEWANRRSTPRWGGCLCFCTGNRPIALLLVGWVETGGWDGLYLLNDGIQVRLLANLLAITVGNHRVVGPDLTVVEAQIGVFQCICHADGGVGGNDGGGDDGAVFVHDGLLNAINDQQVLPGPELDGEPNVIERASGLDDGIVVITCKVEGKWNVECVAGKLDGGSGDAEFGVRVRDGSHDGVGEPGVFFVWIGERGNVPNHVVVPVELALGDEEGRQEVHVIGGQLVHGEIVELQVRLINDVVTDVPGPTGLITRVGNHLGELHAQPNVTDVITGSGEHGLHLRVEIPCRAALVELRRNHCKPGGLANDLPKAIDRLPSV